MRRSLHLERNFWADQASSVAYARFVRSVFDIVVPSEAMECSIWNVFGWFSDSGECAAGVEVGFPTLVLDGIRQPVAAIRRVGVAEAYRGRGLFRDCMQKVIAFCEEKGHPPILLYTESETLYSPLGFVPVAQHAFVGLRPPYTTADRARPIDRAEAVLSIKRVAPRRAPVSKQCAFLGATDLLLDNLDDGDLRFAYAEAMDAMVIYETNDAELVIVDIVAPAIPTMAEIAAALGADETRRIRALFPPDLLHWEATPVRDETGLMLRGRLPDAMRRPFMLPPTTSF